MQILRKNEEFRTSTPPNGKSELQTFIGIVVYHTESLAPLTTASAPVSDLLS